MPRRPPSFRVRLAAITALLSALVLVLFGSIAWALSWRLGVDGVDRSLRETAQRALNRPGGPDIWRRPDRPFAAAENRGPTMLVWERDGRELFRSPAWPAGLDPARFRVPDAPRPPRNDRMRPGANGPFPPMDPRGPLRGEPPPGPPEFNNPQRPAEPPLPVVDGGFQTLEIGAVRHRVALFANADIAIAIAANLAPLSAELAQLARVLALAAIPGLLLVAAAAGWIASRALRPVARVTAAAEGITAQGLDRRIALEGESAEFERLIGVFNDMLGRLETSFRQASRFSADAAHELKTPLAILQGRLEQGLREVPAGSTQQQVYVELLDEVQRLKGIVRKLLLLSLADAGRLPLERQPLDLSAAVREVVDDSRELAPALTIDAEIEPGLVIQADPDLFGQVLRNLVDNAIKYNRDGGWIRVTLKRDGANVRLSVANSATPIPAADRDRVFERFFRADPSRSRSVEGAGLGLSLAREIARAHGGELVLAKSDEQGTEFVLRV